MDQQAPNQETQHALTVLEALKQASKDLQRNPTSTIQALLDLETEANTIFSTNPNHSELSDIFCNLKTLLGELEKSQGNGLRSILRRQVTNYKISRVACTIEAKIQAWIDQESVQNLVKTLIESVHEDEKMKVLIEFENRVLQGFDRDFQDLVLRAKIFSILELILCDSTCSKRIQEQAAVVIEALVRFNKDVFVGEMLMGPTIEALISIASYRSIRILYSFMKLIKSFLIDQIVSSGDIPRIIRLLCSEELSVRVAVMDCILEIGYSGRKEAIEAVIEQGLIEKLMQLQRTKHGDDLNESENRGVCVEIESEAKIESEERRIMNDSPFASCVARFAVQVEEGEGLERKEKIALKMEILRRVREASVSEAECATIVAEVLWGSSP